MQSHSIKVITLLSITVLFITVLSACGGGGGGGTLTPAPTSVNISPTADAGADQSVDEQTAVILSGSGTDSDGSVADYRWAQTAGQSVTLTNSSSTSASFSSPTLTTEMILTFQLTVTDNDGATTTDTTDVIVLPVNVAPTADAGTDQSVDEQTTVTLSAIATDSDGVVASYSWAQTTGEPVALTTADSASTSFDPPTSTNELTLTFQLTVTDNEGATITDNVDVVVLPVIEDDDITHIVINEAASKNAILDDIDGDSPDWIELYNGTNNIMSLANWSITDNADDLAKWIFPDISMAPKGYLLVWASDKDRQFSGQYRSFVTTNNAVKYLVPNDTTSSDWMDSGFDDNTWLNGTSGIGYGDGDDNTIVTSGIRSVFTRFTFNLDNITALDQLLLDIDYDDSFVAYLNGKEIARNNISGSKPTYNTHANASHEALIYSGGIPERFDVSAFIDILNEGENILAIQVHNHGEASSDMSLIPYLTGHITQNNGVFTAGQTPPDILNLSDDELHTNFKLSSGSPETLYLSDSKGELIDSLVVSTHSLNGSVGLNENGDVVQFISPTPYLKNADQFFSDVVTDEVEFSHQGGLTDVLNLTLSGAQETQQIRYTVDNSRPTDLSTLYKSPISIGSNTVIRAAIFEPDFVPSITQSRAYLVGQGHDLPVISLITEDTNLWDRNNGMYVSGPNASPDFPFFNANFWQDWEKPMHLSIYKKDQSLLLEMDLGAKIFGGWSRGNDQRSFSLFSRGRYGKSAIKGELFDDVEYKKFQALVLRNSGQDWLKTMFKDVATSRLMVGSGIDYQAAQPSVVYINGEYWGLYNLREKVNEHFLASKHDVDFVDIVEGNGELVHGDNRGFQNLMSVVESSDLSEDGSYAYVAENIDIDNFIRYQVAQIYFDNHDWPGNNIKMWRPTDGKWRWILYDTDFSFNNFPDWHEQNSFDSLTFATAEFGDGWPNPPWSTLLLRSLLSNDGFRINFINQFADELNSRFEADHVYQHIATQAAVIESEMPAQQQRWADSSNIQDWQNEVSIMQTFALVRPGFIRGHIQNFFNISSIYQLTINNNLATRSVVKLNSLALQQDVWQGQYFSSIPIQIEAMPQDGVIFSHWIVNDVTIEGAVIELTPNEDVTIEAVFIQQ